MDGVRVLFITPYVPGPVRTRAFGFVRALHSRGHLVTVCALQTDDASADAVRPFCDAVHVVPHSRARAVVNCARALPTPTPLWAAYCVSPQMADTVKRLCAAQTFDVAHVEHFRASSFARALPPELPIVYDAVDCLTDLQAQLCRLPSRSAVSRLLSWEEWLKLRTFEPRVTQSFANVICTTQAEASALGRGTPVPNGVDLDGYDADAPYPANANVVFTGKMSYAPNADAAVWFTQSVWPLVRRALPHATFTVAGSAPTKAVQRLTSPKLGIVVTGRVPDLRPYLDAATVAVCPLRVGVGVQNKVLEAMAAGRAVVVSPLAASGLAGNTPLRVAEGAGEFADAVIDLLTHPRDAETLGRAVRQFVQTHHDWNTSASALETVYRRAMGTLSP